MSQSLQDVQSQLIEMRRLLVSAIADEQRLYQRFADEDRQADRWRRRAELAVSRGIEELVRAALERSGKYEARAAEYRQQYLDQKNYVEGMKRRLRAAEAGARGGAGVVAAEGRFREERVQLAAWAELERDEVAERLAAMERDDLLERQLAELKEKLGK